MGLTKQRMTFLLKKIIVLSCYRYINVKMSKCRLYVGNWCLLMYTSWVLINYKHIHTYLKNEYLLCLTPLFWSHGTYEIQYLFNIAVLVWLINPIYYTLPSLCLNDNWSWCVSLILYYVANPRCGSALSSDKRLIICYQYVFCNVL